MSQIILTSGRCVHHDRWSNRWWRNWKNLKYHPIRTGKFGIQAQQKTVLITYSLKNVKDPLGREDLLSFHRLRELLLIICFLLWCFKLCNHLHAINCNIWLLSTTTTSFLYRSISILLILNIKVVTPCTDFLALASIIYSLQSILRIPNFQSLLEFGIILVHEDLGAVEADTPHN
uniref:Similar to NRPB1 (RNA POLYMERASE II LARGE SUBUNIT) n=1 Tax=Arundo donax TaxID=35708 RepID=A0A0A9CP66_ARUDO